MRSIQNEALFHENIARWSRINPKKALLLPYLDDSTWSFCETTKGEPNLKREGTEKFVHAQTGALEEATQLFHQLELRIADVIYVYGVGLGYFYDAAKTWLHEKPSRALIFLEDDLSLLHRLFQTERGTIILNDPQVHLVAFDDLEDNEKIFDEFYWNFVLTQMEFAILPSYEATKPSFCEELKHKVVYDAAIKNALVEEYLKYGAGFFRNFYQNMLMLPDSWEGSTLFNKFEGIPAIICGAGPSLGKNIDQLHHYRDNALIFGGGSSLNALSSHSILPHFGIGIDPNPTQQYRLSSNKAYEVPLFYRNRMYSDAFRLIHGPRLYIPGAGGYDIADWFDEELDVKEVEWLDEGHNVVNFGLELAYHMGCNPIILVGVDLAYTNLQSYAPGVVDDVSVEIDKIISTDDFDTSALKRLDVYGEPIYTLWKWIAEANWIGDYAKERPELMVINSTEGGIGMPNIVNMSLKEAAEKYFTQEYDLNTRVQGEILNSAFPHITNEKVLEKSKTLLKSMQHSIEHIEVLLEDTDALKEKIQTQQALPAILQSGLAALAESDLSEEIAYKYLLDIFNHVYSRILNKEIHQLKMNENEPEWKKMRARCDINHKRLEFLRNVALVNCQFLETAINEREALIKE
jgi:hypothetical protein